MPGSALSIGSALLSPLRDLVPDDGLARRYAASSLVNAVGEGLFISGTAVFGTQYVGLSAEQVGSSLGAAGIVGVVAAGTMGVLADRIGSRRTILLLTGLQGIGYVAYCFVHSYLPFLILTCLLSALAFGKSPAQGALVSAITREAGRVRLRAQARSLFNVGFSVGSGLAAIVLAVGTPTAYAMLPIGNAVTYFAAGYLVRRLPETSVARKRRKTFAALRSGPYLTMTALMTVVAVHGSLTLVVVPLWIVSRTTAPHAAIGLLLTLNTVVCTLFQVRASRGTDTLRGCVAKCWWAAAALLPACLLAGLSGGLAATPAVFTLIGVYLLLTVAEMLQTAGAWGIAYLVAPPHAQAEYLGALGMSMAAQTFVGSTVGTWAVIQHGSAGWLWLGLAICAAAAALSPAVRWTASSLAALHGEAAESAADQPAGETASSQAV